MVMPDRAVVLLLEDAVEAIDQVIPWQKVYQVIGFDHCKIHWLHWLSENLLLGLMIPLMTTLINRPSCLRKTAMYHSVDNLPARDRRDPAYVDERP